MPKVVDFKIIEKTSKKGHSYKALYCVLDDGREIFITYVN